MPNVFQVSGQKIKLQIWDTAGQERYHSLAPMYYRGAQAAVVVYDITSLDSFQRAKSWVDELQRQGSANVVLIAPHCQSKAATRTRMRRARRQVIALAGNKSDLSSSMRKVEPEEAETYANEHGAAALCIAAPH